MNYCVICKSSKNKVTFNEEGVNVFRCLRCGHVYSQHNQSQNYDGYFYRNISSYNNFWWDEAHRKMYDDFFNRYILGRNGCLLDVGCGLGFFIKRISSYKGWDVKGCEISQTAVEFAKNKLSLNNIRQGRVEELNYPPNYFDIITMWDVLEHIPDPDCLLRCLRVVLKDDGIFFIHTPNINIQLPKARIKKFFWKNHHHFLEAKDHINIYSPRTIKMLLEKYGFKNFNFVHLHPIQSVSGSRSIFLRLVKNLWFYLSVVIFYISFKSININNLFLEIRK